MEEVGGSSVLGVDSTYFIDRHMDGVGLLLRTYVSVKYNSMMGLSRLSIHPSSRAYGGLRASAFLRYSDLFLLLGGIGLGDLGSVYQTNIKYLCWGLRLLLYT